MIDRLFGQSAIALQRSGRTLGWLRDALAALPEPWIAVASRRRSGADGPPWVRYIVLHPAKGIALVDVDPAELAVAPLEDFFDHTGLAALQAGGLPIVPVTLPVDGNVAVADAIEAAFAEYECGLRNPNWCEAVVELLLTTPELKLTRLPRRILPVPPIVTPEAPVVVAAPVPPPHSIEGSSAVEPSPAAEPSPEPHTSRSRVDEPGAAKERWLLGSQSLPSRRTWRSWPTLPVAAVAMLLAIAVVLLASPPALPPNEVAANRPLPQVAATASAAPTTVPSLTMASSSPATDRATPPNPPPAATSVSTPPPQPKASAPTVAPPPPARPAPHKLAQRSPVEHYAWQSPRHAPAAPQEQHLASAGAAPAAACADVLHPDRPGGWQYRGPPAPNCLPIRFFGLIGMR